MGRLFNLYKSIRSELYWKERIISILVVSTYIFGNGIEYYNGKLTNDSPLVWILGILLGLVVVVTSLTKFSQYTSVLFKLFLLHINFNIVYAYGQSTSGAPENEAFFLFMCYILFVVSCQALDSRKELAFFTVTELFFYSIITYLKLDNSPLLLQTMHLLILGFVMVGNIIINLQRFKLTQTGGNTNVQFKTLSENGRDAQLILNSKHELVYINPAAEVLTGYKMQEITRLKLNDLIVPAYHEHVQNILLDINQKTDKRVSAEFKIKSTFNREVWVETIFSSFQSEPGVSENLLFAETRDIETRKKLEEEIQQQLRIEEMLIKHSNQFINVERTEIQTGIDVALGEFGKMLGADGVLVYRMHGKMHDEFRSTNQWFDTTQNKLGHHFNLVVKINQQLIIFLRSLKGDKSSHGNFIPLYKLHEIQVINELEIPKKLCYLIPLQSGNIVNGFVVFVFDENIDHVPSSYFGLIGNMVANAFTRLRTEMRLHEAQLTNEFILRALPDWLYMVNKNGEFTGSNNYSTLPPYLPDYALIGQKISDVLPKETTLLFTKALDDVIESDRTSSFEFEDTAIHKGKFFKVLMAPFKANEYLMIIRDVTDLKLAQKDIEAKALKLEFSNKELEEFAYIVSHDMKQPIRTIISYLSLLQKKHSADLNEEGIEFLNYSIDGAKKMNDLIRDILQYSRVEQQINFVTEVDLSYLVKKVLNGLRETITTNNATVLYNELPIIKGNDTMLTELFQNLIENGIKYNTNPKRIVELKVTDEVEFWKFTVADNGIGFEQQYAEQIFKIFKRLHTDNEFQGTGIGLSICQKVVTKHGGKIWAVSEKGKGSVFHFTLPK